MNRDYKNILNELINSYYKNNFDQTIDKLMKNNSFNEKEVKAIISSLCGVKIPEEKDFKLGLKKAITDYSINYKLVEKVHRCNESCTEGGTKPYACKASCPFDAIVDDPIHHNLYINSDLCTDCGMCVNACNEGSFLEKIELLPLINLLKNNEKVIAIVAPAIIGQFGEDVTIDKLRTAFLKIGFTDMIEVAFAADMLSLNEAVEFNHHVKNPDDLLITSCCCPMWIAMIRKVYHNLIKDVSPTVSPMIAAARIIKLLNKNTKVVFIGPCIAKKAEAKEKDLIGDVDLVLTFDELNIIFENFDLDIPKLEETISVEYTSKGGRIYARAGGVSIAVGDVIKEIFPEKFNLYNPKSANGVKECKNILNEIQNGLLKGNFIEGMGCSGGCVGGPKRIISPDKGKEAVDKFAFSSPIKVPYHSDLILDIFKRIGISSIEDLKNPEKTKIFHRSL